MIATHQLTRSDLDRLAALDWGDRGATTRVLFALLPRLEDRRLDDSMGDTARRIGLSPREVERALFRLLQRGVLVADRSQRLFLADQSLPKAS